MNVQVQISSAICSCYPAYRNSISRGDVEPIQKLQNSAIRFIFYLKQYDHASPFRDAANLLPMESICRILQLDPQGPITSGTAVLERALVVSGGGLATQYLPYTYLLDFRKVRHEVGINNLPVFLIDIV